MSTGITTHAGFLVTATVVLTGAAILCGGAASADPNQDDQFLALLSQQGIPAVSGIPDLIKTAHDVCGELNSGVPTGTVVGEFEDFANNVKLGVIGVAPWDSNSISCSGKSTETASSCKKTSR
jgi:uncharacterized protein DUF732